MRAPTEVETFTPRVATGSPVVRDMAMPRSFKKGGKVKKTGWAKVHKGETVVPAKSPLSGGRRKSKTKAILKNVGDELKSNPPKVLAKTRRKSGAKRANKQRVAILLSKARRAGANIPEK